MSDQGSSGEGSGRRYPRNLQGLLNFCTEHTKSEDAPSGSTQSFTEMDPERRQWLNEAISQMGGTDPVKLMLEDIKVITAPDGSTENEQEKKEAALEDLMDHCSMLDLACDFHKMGGYELLKKLLLHSEAGYRWRAAELLAITVQNNPYCQGAALQCGMLPILLHILDKDNDPTTRVKALYAISCLTRDVPEGQEMFIALRGFSYILRAMARDDEKLQVKAAFMLRAMCESQPKIKDELCDVGMVEQFAALLQGPHVAAHEHFLSALLQLCEGHPRSQEECRHSEFRLAEILRAKQENLKGIEEYQEELDHAINLHCLVFEGKSSDVDR